MKKFAIATGVAVLAVAMIASAQGYAFNTNLTVGSTGSDVVALQTWLMSQGFNIPSVASGAAAKGYFGSQTKAAVVAYQAANGIPNTGFVGPLTRAKLNGTAVATPASSGCPAGYTCTPVGGNTLPPVIGGTAGITTPGVAGTIDLSNGSIVGNGTSVNDGQEVDLGSLALQTGASDMAVSSASLDFNVRPWLYMSSLSIRDTSGKVIAQVDGLNQSMFSEITVGTDYRISIPVSAVLPKATKTYVVLHGVFASSNRSATSISITRADVRATDGTGVTLTSTLGPVASTAMYVSYGGQQGSSLVVSVDSTSPNATIVQTNTGNTQTKDVLLGVFSVKSQNISATLQGLTAQIGVSGAGATVGSTFGSISLKSGNTLLNTGTVTNSALSSTTVVFSNFNLALPMNQYVPISVYATVNGNVDGVTASTSIGANAANFTGIDSSSNALTVSSSGTLPGAIMTFRLSGATLSGLAWNISPTVTGGNLNRYPTQTSFSGSLTVTAGNNALYVSSTGGTALTLATSTGAGSISASITNFTPADGVKSYDPSGYYQVTPGSSRTFTVVGSMSSANASTTANLVGVGVTSVNVGTAAAAPNINITTNLQGLNSDFHNQVYLSGI